MPRIAEKIPGFTTRRGALKAAAATVASAALTGAALPAEQTTCAKRYAEYQTAKAACAAALDASMNALDRRTKMTPPVPAELVAPVLDMSYWNDLAVRVVPGCDPDKPLRFYHDAQSLEKFIANPPPSAAHEWHVARDAVECAKRLLPIARRYQEAIDQAVVASGEPALDAAYETAHDREHEAVIALMNAPIELVTDFRFKARVMRDLLDDGLEVDSETEALCNQLLEWFSRKETV